MPDPYAGRPVSRSTLIEIRRDRQVIEEGYRFLDEKRVLVAQELLRRAAAWTRHWREHEMRQREAFEALTAALERHGLDELQVYPPLPMESSAFHASTQSFLGVPLLHGAALHVQGGAEDQTDRQPVLPSAEAEECAQRFRALLADAAELAIEAANLLRLEDEYRRTERRTRALENVIMPETRSAQYDMESRLEELEQEEAVRTRLFGERD